MKLGLVFNHNKINGKATKFFTGCYAYHTIWVDEENGLMYDMSLLRRRRAWPKYRDDEVLLFDFPEVTRELMEYKLTHDTTHYGVVDYILFGFRWVYHLLGKPTRNAKGKICSEITNEDLIDSGVITPWKKTDAPPSPCDIYMWVSERGYNA